MTERQRPAILLIGYGNPGRRDDGLGPALADAVQRHDLPGLTIDIDYQLSVEHAELIARHDVVIFADAAAAGPEPFAFQPLEPATEVGFTTHSLQPAAVLGLARYLFGARTKGYVLAVRGHRFNEFAESLSTEARANLAAAVQFIEQVIRNGRFDEAVDEDPQTATSAAHGSPSAETEPEETRPCRARGDSF